MVEALLASVLVVLKLEDREVDRVVEELLVDDRVVDATERVELDGAAP